jgi:antitoxin PrlF
VPLPSSPPSSPAPSSSAPSSPASSGSAPSKPVPSRPVPSSTISSKGQVTVPIEVRRRLGLKEGDRVEFVFEDGRTVLRPARTDENPFLAYVGILPVFSSLEEIIAWHRDLRGGDDWEEAAHKESAE